MTDNDQTARLQPVSDIETRGQAIKRRRLALGIDSYRAWAEAVGTDRETLAKAEEGKASERTFDKIEAWLSDREQEMSGPDDDEGADSGTVTFEVYGVYGADRIIVKGPATSLGDLERAVERLLRQHPDE